MPNHPQDNAPRRRAQIKKIVPANPATARHRSVRSHIRKLLSRVLDPHEVDFLLAVWKAGNVRAAKCPKFAVGLLQRGWIERDGRTVRLSDQTRLLLAENVE
jgi:hypothetical protein